MCQKFGLPVDYQPWNENALYQALTHDKKARGNSIKLVLVPELSSASIHQIPLEEMKEFLKKISARWSLRRLDSLDEK